MCIFLNRVCRLTTVFGQSKRPSSKPTKKPPQATESQSLDHEEITVTVADSGKVGCLEDLRLQEQATARDIDSLFVTLRSCITKFQLAEAAQAFSQLISLSRFHHTVREITQRCHATEPGIPTYCFGSSLLYDTFHRQVAIPTETIDYAVGHRHGSFMTVEQVIPLQLESSSVSRAEGNSRDNARVLVEAERLGGILSCYFHTHPGHGPHANLPSPTDFATQKRFEQGGYAVIGGIFSRDGYLRFFTHEKPFNISISGKEVEHVGENLYKLTKIR